MTCARTGFVLLGFAVVGGCFNPDDVDADTDASSGAQTSTATDGTSDPSASSTASTSTASTDTTPTSTTDPTDPTSESSGPDTETTGPQPVICGNGSVEGDEECDDGDLRSGDGCSAACLDESIACAPGLVGALAGPELERLAFKDDYLYGLRSNVPSILAVIDVADPANPSDTTTLPIDARNYPNWNPGDLVASDTHLWTGGINPELLSIDVSIPDAPAFDFFAGPNDSDGPVEVVGNLLFQARSVSERINVWDIANPSAPTPLPGIGNPSQVFRDVAAADDHVIAIAGPHVEVWDVSTPAVPAFVGELDGAPWTGSIRSAANGDTVVLATTGAGVGIIDYALPSAPMVAGTIPDESFPRDIGLRGDFAYVPVTNGLRVYDVSDPADPVLAGSYLEVEVYGISIGLSEDHVYLGTESGIRVLGDMPGLCEARCGNDTVEYPESCDDGNLDDGDGCSAACLNE